MACRKGQCQGKQGIMEKIYALQSFTILKKYGNISRTLYQKVCQRIRKKDERNGGNL